MAVYFVGEYPQLLESLSGAQQLKQSQQDLNDSLATVQAEMDGISTLLDELKGNYKGSLYESFEQLITEITETYNTVNEGLQGAVDNMNGLSTELVDFKEKDETFEQKQEELRTESSVIFDRPAVIEEKYKEEYLSWKQRVAALENTVNEVRTQLLFIKESCDSRIKSIEMFNQNIVEIRLSLASIAYGTVGYSLDDIKNLTPEEREKILNDIIEKMTTKYQEYKDTYEKFANLNNLDEKEKQTFYGVLGALGLFNTANGGWSYGNFQSNIPKRFSDYTNLILLLEENNVLDAVDNYFDKGMSWKESGMEKIANKFVGRNMTDEDQFWTSLSTCPWINDSDRDNPEIKKEIATDFKQAYKGLAVAARDGKMFYDKTIEMGTAIKQVKQLNNHVKYDIYTLRDDYGDFSRNTMNEDDMFNDLFINANIPNLSQSQYLTYDERKMLEYLYSQGEDGLKLCEEYMSSLSDSLNKREGYIKATLYYEGLISGNNESWDAIWDHLSVGATGYGDGLVDFCDGLVDIVSPSRELSANEYAKLALVGYLETDDGYSKSLKTAYDYGSSIGKETIPTVISLFGGKSFAKGLKTASDFGNNVENFYRSEALSSMDASEALIRSYSRAGIDLVSGNAIDQVGKATGLDSSPLGRLTLSTFKTLESCATEATLGNQSVDVEKKLYSTVSKWVTGEGKKYVTISGGLSEDLKNEGNNTASQLTKLIMGKAEDTVIKETNVEKTVEAAVKEVTKQTAEATSDFNNAVVDAIIPHASAETVTNVAPGTVTEPPRFTTAKVDTGYGYREVTTDSSGATSRVVDYDTDGELTYDITFDTNERGEKVATLYEGNKEQKYVRSGTGGIYTSNGENYRWDQGTGRMVRI